MNRARKISHEENVFQHSFQIPVRLNCPMKGIFQLIDKESTMTEKIFRVNMTDLTTSVEESPLHGPPMAAAA